ncbi:oligosaccharide flippase family protein [Vagococcus humatus]|uniref:Flippase n=1 Tax=Vagococcus humatus TaxID=1889241 RepID=A0A3R9YFE1_9ENTE|nr:oligosaccharide flippase family protein [Vagococcus humatus]RST89913.1 flippase [Vagococcus humatus]
MNKVIKNFAYQSIFQIAKLLLPIITIPIVSQALGPKGIGIYNYINSISQYFILIASLGLNVYANREVAMNRDSKEKRSKTFWEIFYIQLIFSVISFVLYLMMILFLVKEYQLLYVIQGLVILATILDISWFFMGLEDFKKTSMTNLAINMIAFIFIFLCIKEPNDLYKYVIIQVASIILSQGVVWFYLKNLITYHKVTLNGIMSHFKPALTYFIPKVSIVLYTNMNKTLLGLLSNKTDVGFYSNAVLINTIFVTILTTLDLVLMPKMSHLFSKKNTQKMLEIINYSLHFQLYFSIAIMCGMWAIYDKLVYWFFGLKFIQLNDYIPILSILIVIIPLGMGVSRQYLLPMNRIKVYNIAVIMGAILGILLNLLLIPSIGIYGAIVATICSEFFVTFIRTRSFIKETHFRFDLKQIFGNLAIGLLMVFCVRQLTGNFPSTILTTLIQALIGATIYLSLTTVCKINPLYNYWKLTKVKEG